MGCLCHSLALVPPFAGLFSGQFQWYQPLLEAGEEGYTASPFLLAATENRTELPAHQQGSGEFHPAGCCSASTFPVVSKMESSTEGSILLSVAMTVCSPAGNRHVQSKHSAGLFESHFANSPVLLLAEIAACLSLFPSF